MRLTENKELIALRQIYDILSFDLADLDKDFARRAVEVARQIADEALTAAAEKRMADRRTS